MNKKLLAALGILALVALLTASTTINGVRIISSDLTVQGIFTTANGAVLGSPASIVLPSGATGTTQASLDNSTKIATTAYVDGSRGLKGNAYFSPKTGSISGLVTNGIITNVTRSSTGIYSVTLSSTTGVVLFLSSDDDGTGFVSCQPNGSGTSLASPVGVTCVRLTSGVALVDPGFVMIAAFVY